MKIGIYGGSFNPPHLGHLAAARAAAEELGLDKLLVVPAGIPPHKDIPSGSPAAEQRLAMAKIFVDQLRMPFAECWDIEVRREGKSYTADTLRTAKELWPDSEFWLLMGTDMFLSLQCWREPGTIMGIAGICAFSRSAEDTEQVFAAQRNFLTETYGARIATISVPGLVEISSTEIREYLRQGRGREFLPEAVLGYILRERLYGTSCDLSSLTDEELRCVSYSMVYAKRLPHIRGTEETAVSLAVRWGEDPEKMRRAAILHDCTKYLSLQEHLEICNRYEIALDELERGSEKLLHSKSGAALSKYIFGQDDEIFQAILYHTTGRADMSLAEKILYLADYIEPCRDFPEVGQMRELAFENLDQAVLMGVRLSIQEMIDRNRVVHPNTLGAEKTLLKGLEE